MNKILCFSCGYDIDSHGRQGRYGLAIGDFCDQTPSDIAAHAVQAAVSEAVKVIKGMAEMSEWSTVELGYLRGKAAAYLAAHTEPQDVRTDAERAQDEFAKEVADTRQSDYPL